MPHSSGGGSHSGGSHHSSHRSYSSRSGGYRSHSSGSTRHISTTSFAGSKKYMYYDRRHRAHYVYSNVDLTKDKNNFSPFRLILLLVYIPFFMSLIPMYKSAVIFPHKIDGGNISNEIVIEDQIDVMTDKEEEKLTDQLEKFQKETGITPAIITCSNEEYKDNTTLENYSYDLYVNRWTDETHWLIVYSSDKDYILPGEYEQWFFEGMQGDETDSVLTNNRTLHFNEELNRALTARSQYSVAEAFQNSFQSLTKRVAKTEIQPEQLGVSIAVTAFLLFHSFFMCGINELLSHKKYLKPVEVSENTKESVCEYCGCAYTEEVRLKYGACTHCGAPLKPISR